MPDKYQQVSEALTKFNKAFIAYNNTLVQWTAPDGIIYIDTYPAILALKADYQI
jgi:hypothetical protein